MKVVEKKARGEVIERAGETEGARRATGVFPAGAPTAGAAPGAERPEVEVVAKAERRRFTAEYKRRIVREADRGLWIAQTCAGLGLPTATYYRRSKPQPAPRQRPRPPRAQPTAERAAVLEVLHESQFVDLAPAQVYAQLLDAERYLCSERTMYRILEIGRAS